MSERTELIREIFATLDLQRRLIHGRLTRQMEKTGLSPAQAHLLPTIAAHEPVSFKALAAELRLTPGAVTQFVDSLEQAGLIIRQTDQKDRRVVCISLSPAGHQKLDELQRMRDETFGEILATLDEQELSVFLNIQRKMIAHFEQKDNEKEES